MGSLLSFLIPHPKNVEPILLLNLWPEIYPKMSWYAYNKVYIGQMIHVWMADENTCLDFRYPYP
jgi:hypothetical protein